MHAEIGVLVGFVVLVRHRKELKIYTMFIHLFILFTCISDI